MIEISCAAMGAPCDAKITGDSVDDFVEIIQDHAKTVHDYTDEEANDPDKVNLWRGAVRQTARPSETRTIKLEF